MKTSKLLTTLFGLFCAVASFAQLPDGSLAPDFTAIDTDGNSHNLQTYLD